MSNQLRNTAHSALRIFLQLNTAGSLCLATVPVAPTAMCCCCLHTDGEADKPSPYLKQWPTPRRPYTHILGRGVAHRSCALPANVISRILHRCTVPLATERLLTIEKQFLVRRASSVPCRAASVPCRAAQTLRLALREV